MEVKAKKYTKQRVGAASGDSALKQRTYDDSNEKVELRQARLSCVESVMSERTSDWRDLNQDHWKRSVM